VRALADVGQFLDRGVGHGGLVGGGVGVAPGGQERAQVVAAAGTRRHLEVAQVRDDVARVVAVAGLDIEHLLHDRLGVRSLCPGQPGQQHDG